MVQSEIVAKPFLRWAGGKRWLVSQILKRLPNDINGYYEPFLGAGNIFFNIREFSSKCFLSDINSELIMTYIEIKRNVNEVIRYLDTFKNDKDSYLKIRAKKYNNLSKEAAKFIYLNKTSFNGIYRVNRNGDYNVPYGHKKNALVNDKSNLKAVSNVLRNVSLKNIDFEIALKNCKPKDLIYIDPPYTVAHENNGFIMYNAKLFSWNDQERLSIVAKALSDKGCYILISNAYHESVSALYQGFEMSKISRNSYIAGTVAGRKIVNEYLISNF